MHTDLGGRCCHDVVTIFLRKSNSSFWANACWVWSNLLKHLLLPMIKGYKQVNEKDF